MSDLNSQLRANLQSFFGHSEVSGQQSELADAIANAVIEYVEAYVRVYVAPDDAALGSLGRPISR
jgi:hypothetical protein